MTDERYAALLARMRAGGVVLLDGGTGTELERRGAPMDASAWCGAATAEHAGLLQAIHRDYIEAGAEIVIANTFASSRPLLAAAGLGDRVEAVNRQAVEAALRARDEAGRPEVLVAGSLSHMLPPESGTEADAAGLSDALRELAGILRDAGCDLIILEMMYRPARIPAALEAALGTGLPVWAGLSARAGADGGLLGYESGSALPFDDLLAATLDPALDAVGIMHTNVSLIGPALAAIARAWDGPRFAYPDSGYFTMPHWRFEEIIPPEDLHREAVRWVADGCAAVGVCCGLGPGHIAALAPLRR